MTLEQQLLLLFGSLFLAWIVNLIFKSIIPFITKRTKTDTDDKILAAIRYPLTFLIFYSSVHIILTPYTDQQWVNIFLRSIQSLLIIYWGFALDIVIEALLEELNHRIGNHGTTHELIPFLKSTTRITMILLTGVVLLGLWEIDITPLLAAGGVAGIALAFAAKDTIANIFGGISVFLDRPYKIGDYIILDNQSNERGEVLAIGARTTKIKTRDDVLISIPNSIMSTTKIVNETGLNPPLRIRVKVGLPYGCDLEKAEQILFNSIKSCEDIIPNPPPRVRYRYFDDSSVVAEVMGWIDEPWKKGQITHKVIKLTHRDLRKHKIHIPFPQRDVHLYKK